MLIVFHVGLITQLVHQLIIESVLNFVLMSLSLTLGMMGMNMWSPENRTVMLGLLFSDPNAEPDVVF